MTLTVRRYLRALIAAVFILAIGAQGAVYGVGPDQDQRADSKTTGTWRLVRSPHPQGGPDAVSIMHTADTSKSDLDLVGLMVRCSHGGAEVLMVLIRPFSLRARPRVAVGKPGDETRFEATVVPPGTAVLLPRDATALVNGSWQSLPELFVEIADDQGSIRGVIELAGLKPALDMLMANCPSQ